MSPLRGPLALAQLDAPDLFADPLRQPVDELDLARVLVRRGDALEVVGPDHRLDQDKGPDAGCLNQGVAQLGGEPRRKPRPILTEVTRWGPDGT
jgi:hypothetical protein